MDSFQETTLSIDKAKVNVEGFGVNRASFVDTTTQESSKFLSVPSPFCYDWRTYSDFGN